MLPIRDQDNSPIRTLTDIILPEVDGLEVIMTARNKHPDLRIIAMSGGRQRLPTDYNLRMVRAFGAS
jgi:CheY-like chemotaxis protein